LLERFGAGSGEHHPLPLERGTHAAARLRTLAAFGFVQQIANSLELLVRRGAQAFHVGTGAARAALTLSATSRVAGGALRRRLRALSTLRSALPAVRRRSGLWVGGGLAIEIAHLPRQLVELFAQFLRPRQLLGH